ncbi:uncharacterized protein NECHADRAFT_6075, partial [Fusarium vanettenii 77-13-4]
KTRRRTSRQLERKRVLDKISQRQKREKQKAFVRQSEKDIHDARNEIERLRGVIQVMRVGSSRDACNINPVPLRPGSPHSGQVQHPVSMEPGPGAAPSPSAQEIKQPVIGCYCNPKTHKSYSDCFEQTVFDSLMTLNSNPTPIPPIPATPDIADLLFLRDPGDPVSEILYKLMRRPSMDNMVLLCAVYILAYRILRYRFFPSMKTYNDVPEWLRSTEFQDKIPHALYIDFVQFPRLRDAMVLGLVDIACIREDFDADFGRYLALDWPVSESFLITDSWRNTVLNPKFERIACTEESWSLSSSFGKKYPHLAPLVRI